MCMLHAVSMCGILLVMLPSIVSPSMLACTLAFPAIKQSTWPTVNSSVLVMGM